MRLKTLFLSSIAATTCLLSGASVAQTVVSYTSPIADYQPFVDEKVSSWRAANDKVGQIGGWRAYAKEAQQPDNTPTPSQKSGLVKTTSSSHADPVKNDPHAGHKP